MADRKGIRPSTFHPTGPHAGPWGPLGPIFRKNQMNTSDMSNADLLMAVCGPVGRILAKRPLTEVFGLKPCRQKEMVLCEDRAPYMVHPQLDAAKELLARAMLEGMRGSQNESLNTPDLMKAFLRCKIGHLSYEVFWVLFLDSQNRLIAAEEMFRGTITQTAVYPREVLKRAMALNAVSVTLSHNHPSGISTPSHADEHLTRTLKTTLALVDVRVLDHIIVCGESTYSMAERGLM